jgi:hypothetical protein
VPVSAVSLPEVLVSAVDDPDPEGVPEGEVDTTPGFLAFSSSIFFWASCSRYALIKSWSSFNFCALIAARRSLSVFFTASSSRLTRSGNKLGNSRSKFSFLSARNAPEGHLISRASTSNERGMGANASFKKFSVY